MEAMRNSSKPVLEVPTMNKLLAILCGLLLVLPVVVPAVHAADFDGEISPEDQATFDQILEPVMKIYNFIKYAATVLAVVFLVFAGVSFILSGGDTGKRESAKTMATYIVIGLIIIWVAPLIVQYLVG
jgi:type IV secretory pathway VirB2 component (pilin)